MGKNLNKNPISYKPKAIRDREKERKAAEEAKARELEARERARIEAAKTPEEKAHEEMVKAAKEQIDYDLAESFIKKEDYEKDEPTESADQRKPLTKEQLRKIYGRYYEDEMVRRQREKQKTSQVSGTSYNKDEIMQLYRTAKTYSSDFTESGDIVADSISNKPQVYSSENHPANSAEKLAIQERLVVNKPSNLQSTIHKSKVEHWVEFLTNGFDPIIRKSYKDLFDEIRANRNCYDPDDETFDKLRARIILEINDEDTLNQERKELAQAVVSLCTIRFLESIKLNEISWQSVLDAIYEPVIDTWFLTTNQSRSFNKNHCYESIGKDCIITFSPDDKTPMAIYKTDAVNIKRAILKRETSPSDQQVLKECFEPLLANSPKPKPVEYKNEYHSEPKLGIYEAYSRVTAGHIPDELLSTSDAQDPYSD